MITLEAGQKFGRLTVVEYSGKNHLRKPSYRCLCDCGNTKVAELWKLVYGNTRSCGCLREEMRRKRLYRHGMTNTSEMKSYIGARERCNNPRHAGYHNYGGRGIEFKFESFEQFFKEMGPRPSAKHSIDRIDVNGNYEPGNVRWATQREQNANRRVKRIDEFSEEYLLTELFRRTPEYGLSGC